MASLSLEERVSALEAELAELKSKLEAEKPRSDTAWWKKIVGVFEGDPEFDEAMRLGREYRESLRPPEAVSNEETA